MEDTTNGVKLLLTDIDKELDKKLSGKDKVLLRSTKYLLENLPPMREDIKLLKTHDVVQKAIEHPKGTWLLGIGLLVGNSMINWASIRKPLIQAAIHMVTGVMVPLDSIP